MHPKISVQLVSLAAGMICGFLVSIPIGPVNLTIINRALRRGFVASLLAGLGAIVAESIYAFLALAGHAWLSPNGAVMWTLRGVALVVMTVLGVRDLLWKPEKLEASAAVAERKDEQWHHPRSFLLGFALAISNLMLLLVWATLATVLFAHDWVQPTPLNRAVCLCGVLLGGGLWYFLLSFFVSRAHRHIQPATMTFLVRSCGVVLLLFAALLTYKLIRP